MAQIQQLPIRLHHNAHVSRDQEKPQQFYEEIIGLPLIAPCSESDQLFAQVHPYVHTFYGIGDGGALAFFQFADPEEQEDLGPKMPSSSLHHCWPVTTPRIAATAQSALSQPCV